MVISRHLPKMTTRISNAMPPASANASLVDLQMEARLCQDLVESFGFHFPQVRGSISRRAEVQWNKSLTMVGMIPGPPLRPSAQAPIPLSNGLTSPKAHHGSLRRLPPLGMVALGKKEPPSRPNGRGVKQRGYEGRPASTGSFGSLTIHSPPFSSRSQQRRRLLG
eukprot:GEMP01059198.1.p1 GENE.GEMP01059198.1~~GEMP01059198.1.p1  ORF type:complete len:165 (+),score=36.29 GEMP01059198.1:226-720(+)